MIPISLFGLLLISSCKKKNSIVASNCKINYIDYDGKYPDAFTYSGDQLIRWTEHPQITHDYMYQSGKITSIIWKSPAATDTSFVTYDGNGRVKTLYETYNGMTELEWTFEWNNDGSIHKMLEFSMDTDSVGQNFILSGHFFTYQNGKIKSIETIWDKDGNGKLDVAKDESEKMEATAVGTEENPLYGWLQYQDDLSESSSFIFYCSKHLINEYIWSENGGQNPEKVTLTYDFSSGRLVKASEIWASDPTPYVYNFGYLCQ